jgi:hypothetical protein
MTRLVKVGHMPEVFSVPKLGLWCFKCFDATKRVIHVGEANLSLVSLRPIIFQKMLRLRKPNKYFKLTEVDSFLGNNGGKKNMLSRSIDSLVGIKPGTYQFHIDLLRDP